MARILVIDESQKRAVDICSGLIQAGHQVAAVLPSAQELIERIEEIKPDIILIETESPSRDTLEHLAVMNRDMPRPVVMFSQDGDSGTIRSAIQAGVAAYVVDGFDIGRLKPVVDVAVARFDEHQSMKRELADAGRKLSERKLIDKAKGILMKSRGLDEDAAYAALRKLAMEQSQPLAKVAANLVDMARLLL
ncbi:MAG: ANTAR domain-containing protein [Rhodocyclaceae bacterium]|jgi:response regulator NasT|nr:ANTAR domain-containing protein [Rhodocyclaceae bacterium]MDP2171434.1 ANTAR domain-containing protein [Rhodocyclaceae bacterium]MDP3032641.1 ANTAR domain-containing protein [Rhodocyclaceae bacterium]